MKGPFRNDATSPTAPDQEAQREQASSPISVAPPGASRASGGPQSPPTEPVAKSPKNPRKRKRRGRPASERGNARNTDGETVYAALDLGTNNCRLLCARPSRRGFMVVDAFSRIIRLGEGVSQSGELSKDAMDRTIRALRVCAEKMARRDVKRSRLIATEACRIARNGDDFIRRVRAETGLRLEIVDRETEAQLAVSGCASLLDKESDWALVFDIGGGSSELIWLDLNKRESDWSRTLSDRVDAQNCIHAWTSLPVGVVTLAEKFGGKFVDDKVFEDMVDHVYRLLETFEAEHLVKQATKGKNVHLLGTSGTVTTVAGIHLKLPRYDRRRVDGCWLHLDEARKVTRDLVSKNYNQRVAEPCIGSDRADLVLAGCAILEALLRMWPCERLRVADRGLREGILSLLMAEDGVHNHARPRGRRRRKGHRT